MIEQYLSEHYEKGEPIFLSDLGLEGMTEENLRYHLKRMTDEGKICRFAPGIYYFQNESARRKTDPLAGDGSSAQIYPKKRKTGRLLLGIYPCKPSGTVNTGSIQRRNHKQLCTGTGTRSQNQRSNIHHPASGGRNNRGKCLCTPTPRLPERSR